MKNLVFLIPILIGVLLCGCSLRNKGTDDNEPDAGTAGIQESTVMDYENATLREVKYSWSSGTMARAAFSIQVNEKEIVNARYYPMNHEADDYDMHEIVNVPVSEKDWKAICDAVDILCPVLKEVAPVTEVKKSSKKYDMEILDGGDTFDFELIWEIDGELVSKEYCNPDYERFCVLDELLAELADPIGREIPVYTPPILNGAWVSIGKDDGKDRYSFQCQEVKDSEGEYYFFCYYPENGKEVRYPNSRVDEAVWQVINDKISELGIEKMEPAAKDDDCITLYYSNGKQPVLKLNKDAAEALKETFMELML